MACIVRNQINLWSVPQHRNPMFNFLVVSGLTNFAALSVLKFRDENLGLAASVYTFIFAVNNKAHEVAVSALTVGTTIFLNHSLFNRSIAPWKLYAVALASTYFYASCYIARYADKHNPEKK
jgi:hypothetical protein